MDEIVITDKQRIAASQHLKEKNYWLHVLQGDIVRTNFPYDRQELTFEGRSSNVIEFALPEETCMLLTKLSADSDIRLHIILTASVAALFHKYSGAAEVTLGMPIYKQNVEGDYINKALALRIRLNENAPFKELLNGVRMIIANAVEHQDYPIEVLVEDLKLPCSDGDFPLFDSVILLKNIHDKSYIQHIPANMIFSFERSGQHMIGNIEYNSLRYKEETVNHVITYLQRLLIRTLPDLSVQLQAIEILSEEEKRRLMEDFNNTVSEFPKNKTIVQLFEEMVANSPNRIVLSNLENKRRNLKIVVAITYEELNRRSTRLAEVLRTKGVKAGDIVGLMINRSLEMIIALLGILKSGAAYLPIDNQYPDERIDYMLKDSGARIILTMNELLAEPGGIEVLHELPGQIFPHNIAYVLYTSGSTGKPKGVMVEHGNVVRLVKNSNFIDFTNNDRLLLTGTIAFDITTFEIWTPLTNGFTLFLAPQNEILDADRLSEILISEKISILHFIPQLFNQMAEHRPEIFAHLNYLLVGGDMVRPHYVNKIRNLYPKLKILHMYGPTENTTFSTFFPVETNYEATIPIGKPIANSTVYILDKRSNRLQPEGITGEICVSGVGVARGYLNNPELTGEKFTGNPFKPGEKMYRTGDIGRWTANGDIEFFGRMDHQIKIRGYRIEIGEIENRLLQHEKVKETIIINRERSGNKEEMWLCAYIVPVNDPSLDKSQFSIQLKSHLSEKLPGYMIPSRFIYLDQMPLTPNGKIDKKALPEPGPDEPGKNTAPGSMVEKKLVKIWSTVLKIEEKQIGIDADFFELGGHSLDATLLILNIHKELSVKLKITDVFQFPTIRKMAEYLQGVNEDIYLSIKPVEKKEYYALSSAQKRLYVLQQMDTGLIAYNMPLMTDLGTEVDIPRIEKAFRKLITRHESLRTSFIMNEGLLLQKVYSEKEIEFKLEHYVVDAKEKSIGIKKILQDFVRPFDLSQAPLLRAGIIKGPDGPYTLAVDMHHIITDGTSHMLLIKEFIAFYRGEELPALRLQYKDYAQCQQAALQEAILKQEHFWLNEFAEEIPALLLPIDYPRPSMQNFEGDNFKFQLKEKQRNGLYEIMKWHEATLFMVLISIYSILLAKISNQEDIVIGTPIAGRNHADLQDIIGMFVNTLPIRTLPSGEKKCCDFINEVKEKNLLAFENQDYPFEELVEKISPERDMSRNPLFDCLFTLENISTIPVNPGEKAEDENNVNTDSYNRKTAKFDLSLSARESRRTIFCSFEYCSQLFKEKTITKLGFYFERLISSIIENPECKISDVEILSGEEKKQILYDFNNMDNIYPKDKTIHCLFSEQVKKTPDHIALLGPFLNTLEVKAINHELSLQITYRELDEISGGLAGILIKKGVEANKNTIVAVMMERSVEMITGIFGILKAGGAYLPIDPGFPQERIDYMLKDSGTRVLIKSEFRNPKLETNSNDQKINVQNKDFKDLMVLNFENLNLNPLKGCPRRGISNFDICASDFNSSNLCYIIYTSGSTGKPKGVMIEHHSLVNRLNWMQKTYPIDKRDTILQKTTFTFDVSVWEIFWWSIVGARLFLLFPGGEKDPGLIIQTIEKNNITTIHFVPSMLSVFLDYLKKNEQVKKLSCLKQVFVSGEALLTVHAERFNELLKKDNGTLLTNLYGPTEATIDVSYFNCLEVREDKIIPIGKPIDNINLYILDRSFHLLPIGVMGELHIGGVGLARGYLNQPELTTERFINFQHSAFDLPRIQHSKLYCTGDLARWLIDGNIEFLGRIDHQVKIRGFRIELGEIETRLLMHHEIKNACVIIKENKSGDKFLTAYIVAGKEIPVSVLREHLEKHLPHYMIPLYFIFLEQIPLTPNGKIDRKALPNHELKAGYDYIAPSNEIEKKLAQIWSELLDVEQGKINVEANFFLIGGHSLKAAQMVAKIHKEFNQSVTLAEIFKTPTIRSIASLIKVVDWFGRANDPGNTEMMEILI